MKQYYVKNNSDKLIMFFAGWGCDEHEFEHLKSESDVLILYEYENLDVDFDFCNYREINVLAFSAGVFISSIYDYKFKIKRKIGLSGNPYLFDENLGLTQDIIKVFRNITEENCDEFTKNYLIKTEEENRKFKNSKRTIKSCNDELDSLKRIYEEKKYYIKNDFDEIIIGDEDPIFNAEVQKEFYGKKLKIIKNARHNLFFRINSYEDILNGNIK